MLDLYRQVLDHEIVDCEDLPCGTVDDMEVEGTAGESLRVTALLVGPGAWGPRLPALFAFFARLVCGRHVVRVPWPEIAEIGEKIKLCSRAAPLGLGVKDRQLGLWLAKIPGSEKSAP
jgi:hypothetical protein